MMHRARRRGDNRGVTLPAVMLRFAPDESLPPLQARLDAATDGPARTGCTVELAWHLRQRDCHRALALAEAVQAQPTALWQPHAGRLALVRAEVAWLQARLDEAEALLAQAAAAAGDDALLRADLAWLEASLVNDRGRYDAREAAVARSAVEAGRAGDAERVDQARLALLCFEAFADPARALAAHGEAVRAWLDDPRPAVAALAHGFMHHGLAADGRYGQAIEHGLQAAALALRSGQLRRALIDRNNTATLCLDMNDAEGALELLQECLPQARATGWPHVGGVTLACTALALQKTGRHAAAGALADEALALLAPVRQAKAWYIAAQARAGIALAAGEWETARGLCEQILAVPPEGDLQEMPRFASQALAEALLGAGRPGEARPHARRALALSADSGDLPSHIDALRLLARIARSEADCPDDTPLPAAREALEQALHRADASPDLQLPPTLLDELAAELARGGDHARAFALLRRACTLRDARERQQADRRAVALEVRLGTERAQAEAQRQRLLAQAQTQRAQALDALNQQLRSALDALETARAQLERRNGELRASYAAMKDLSLTDPLTGLRNRRYLMQTIDQDVAHAVRQHETRAQRLREGGPARREDRAHGTGDLLFFLIDLDHFKQVNDRHGHAAGDSVLQQFRTRLQAVFRDSDHIVRWGGEEFLVVARGSRRACAPSLAERLRRRVADEPFVLPDGQALAQTCSIGFAAFPPDPQRPREGDWMGVIEQADQHLYEAKRQGRNRWIGGLAAEPPDPGTPSQRGGDIEPGGGPGGGAEEGGRYSRSE